MPNKNQVELIGHIVRKPELKYLNDGTGVCNFTLALNRGYETDEVDFVKVVAWNMGKYKLAEYAAQYEKGDAVMVEGQLRQNKWEDDNGNNRSDIRVRAEQVLGVHMAGNRNKKDKQSKQEKPQKNMSDDFETPF